MDNKFYQPRHSEFPALSSDGAGEGGFYCAGVPNVAAAVPKDPLDDALWDQFFPSTAPATPPQALMMDNLQPEAPYMQMAASSVSETARMSHAGRKQPLTESAALLKAKTVQEKNKKAQQRYRERQKSMLQDCRRQVEDLTERVQSLLIEKASLETRTHLLEKVLRLKDDGQPLLLTEGPAPNLADQQRRAAAEACLRFQHVVRAGAVDEAALVREASVTTPTAQMMYNIYQEYKAALSEAIVAPDAEAFSSTAHQRIVQLVTSAHETLLALNVSAPRLLRTLEKGLREPSRAAWSTLLASINMTELQRAFHAEARRKLVARMRGILARRDAVVAALSGAGAARPAAQLTQGARNFIRATQACPEASTCLGLGLPCMDCDIASDDLRATLEEEQMATTEFAREVFTGAEALTPFQEARLLIEAFPYTAHYYAICRACAVLAGDEVEGANLDSGAGAGPGGGAGALGGPFGGTHLVMSPPASLPGGADEGALQVQDAGVAHKITSTALRLRSLSHQSSHSSSGT